MDDEQATRIAADFGRQQGWEIEDYEVSSVLEADGAVQVLFHGKSGRPGDHFSVYVDATTELATRLIPGR